MESAGLEPITPHAARHSYASIAIAAGVQAKALQTFMGHESITTTLNRCGHLYRSERATAAAQIDRLLSLTVGWLADGLADGPANPHGYSNVSGLPSR